MEPRYKVGDTVALNTTTIGHLHLPPEAKDWLWEIEMDDETSLPYLLIPKHGGSFLVTGSDGSSCEYGRIWVREDHIEPRLVVEEPEEPIHITDLAVYQGRKDFGVF